MLVLWEEILVYSDLEGEEGGGQGWFQDDADCKKWCFWKWQDAAAQCYPLVEVLLCSCALPGIPLGLSQRVTGHTMGTQAWWWVTWHTIGTQAWWWVTGWYPDCHCWWQSSVELREPGSWPGIWAEFLERSKKCSGKEGAGSQSFQCVFTACLVTLK